MDEIINFSAKWGGIIFGFFVAVKVAWKWILDPAYKKIIDYKYEKKIKEIEVENKLLTDFQDKIVSKKLEIETIKLNRVLPELEEINGVISEYMLMYNTYLHSMRNKSGLGKTWENDRVEYDTKIIRAVYKISIYIPPEMRVLLNKMRMIISCSWQDPREGNAFIWTSVYKPFEVDERIMDILSQYHRCFYDMVYNYCNLNIKKVEYGEILAKYGFDEEALKVNRDLLDDFSYVYFLLHEYGGGDKRIDKEKLVRDAFM